MTRFQSFTTIASGSVLAALSLLPAHALAQTGDEDIVVTASGFDQPRSETGQAITIIDRDRLDRLQSTFVGDALQLVPSLSVRQSGGPGGQTSVFIRGANSSQTLVLIDGVRVNDPSSPNGAFDFGGLPVGNIERIEVLSGPNSVIWGSQAIGGVINVRTLAPTKALALNAGGEAGSLGTGALRANLSGSSGPVEASVGGSLYRTDGISALTGGQERDGYRDVGANGRLKLHLAEGVAIDLRGYYNRGRLHYDDPFSPAGPDSLPQTRNRQFVGYAGLDADLLDGRWHNRVAYTRTDINRLGTDPDPFSFNTFIVKGSVNRFEYHGSFDVAQPLTLVYGVEHERTETSTSFAGAVPDIARSHVTSLFAQAIVRPVTGLTLTGGVRHDDYNVYGGHTTFGGNIAYTPNEGRTVLRATYAEGFRAPTVTEGLPPFGNSALKPETARNYDLGIEHHLLDGKVTAAATWFHRSSHDQIIFSLATFQSENIQRVRAKGVELALTVRPTAALAVAGSYSFIDARDRSPGLNRDNQLQRRPRNSASITADWTSPWKLALGGSLLIVGDSFDDAANSVRLDGYALAGVRASYPVTRGIEVYGRVDNLFDTGYEVVGGYGTLGRTATAGVRLKL